MVLIDEIDALQDEALLSVLRQLRSGFPDRPLGFPQSIGLIGLRDVRDYKVASGGSENLNTASPFNIKVDAQHVHTAKENLIRRKDTHLDSLAKRLRERRVREILEPMMAGQDLSESSDEDRDFLVDLGLLRRENSGGLVVANPVYHEILGLMLS